MKMKRAEAEKWCVKGNRTIAEASSHMKLTQVSFGLVIEVSVGEY